MSELFLTKPHQNSVPRVKTPKRYVDFKEHVETILHLEMGYPIDKARELVIDNRPFLIECFKKKFAAIQTVELLIK